MIKTFTPRAAGVRREWRVLDASGQTLGRLATQAALVLRGKHKPTFTPHLDMGDHVVIVNAEQVRVTGQKLSQKVYYRHSGYPGGLKSRTLAQQLALFPTRVIESAVRGMLPRNALGKAMLRKLHVYAGPDHPHRGQVEPGPSRVSSTGTPDSPPRETKPVAASTPVDASVEGEGASAGPEAKSPPRSARRASREQSAETDKELTS